MALLSMVLLSLTGGAALVLLDHYFGPMISSRIPHYSDRDHQETPFNVQDFLPETRSIETVVFEYNHLLHVPREITRRPVRVWEMPFSEVVGGKATTVSCSGCVVCLEEFGEKEICAVLPVCRHVYHPDCLQQWFLRQSTCPLCRRSL
ncbi:RING-H2 finger protein ATL73-like [Carica papaya]|uniref:RING-H2 finger protein ATL73-like n=1 Tax=Carica papaya TaxID=3649 RepID=UPI000B8CC3C5|nr:RING-H2 finger protein ATL73-like [Carica papaya]